jgi:hypothetical protein
LDPHGASIASIAVSDRTNVVGSVFSILGVALFQRTMSGWDFRPVFWVTTVIKICASFVDISIVNRWNLDIGLPDAAAYMMGNAIIMQLAETLDFMPAVVLTSKLCPKEVESTVYAVLAGFQNFGIQLSRTVGVAFLGWFGVRAQLSPDYDPENPDPDLGCDFSHLPYLLLTAHTLLPMLTIPLTFLLIPDCNMKDDLEPDKIEPNSDDADHRGQCAEYERIPEVGELGGLARPRRCSSVQEEEEEGQEEGGGGGAGGRIGAGRTRRHPGKKSKPRPQPPPSP